MTKKSFVFLMVSVLGGLAFALGMCMCLLPEWNLFKPGVVLTAVGAAVLLALAIICWVRAGKPALRINWKSAGKALYCIVALLVLGAGMAMIMAFEGMLLPGITVGVVGMMMALGMIPVLKGLK